MKRVMTLGLTVLMSAPFVAAQYEKPMPQGGAATSQIEVLTPGGGGKSMVMVFPSVGVCPVLMHAKQGSGGGLVSVRGKEPPTTGPVQRIHLVVDHGKKVKVTSAHVRVYGMSGRRNHIQNAMTGPDAAADFRRTLDVGFTAESDRESGADLVLPGFTAVSRIVLQSITYDDGSTWTPGRNQMCAAAPDPFMLVADR
jgi:hypothetical protein